jgi:hypothetical protein
MTRRLRSISLGLGALMLASALAAAPPPPAGSAVSAPNPQTGPAPARPVPQAIVPRCTSGPAPQVHVNIQSVYVQLTWPAVTGATSYGVSRIVQRTGAGTSLTPMAITGTEFWDAVPDIREAYQYTVTAIQSNGCTGSAAVPVSGPYALPNPQYGRGEHPSDTQVVLSWDEQFGAISYRIDGPGIPNTGLYLPGTTFVEGQKPPVAGKPWPGHALNWLSATVNVQGVQASYYTISAQYPNASDYAHPGSIGVPRTQPVITSISPSGGIIGQAIVTITGRYLADPSDSCRGVAFGVPPTGSTPGHSGIYTSSIQLAAPTQFKAVASASGYVEVSACEVWPQGGPYSGRQYEVKAVSPVPFAGANAPPPPPPQVRVPGVVQLGLNDAMQVLRNAGFQPLGGGGPATANAIVIKQVPAGGAMAPAHSAVSLFTVGAASGYSQLTLYNNMAAHHTVNVWLFDQATGDWSGGSSLDFGASTPLTLASGHMYMALVLDPALCGGQNDHNNASCEYWRLPGVPADTNGPSVTVPIN